VTNPADGRCPVLSTLNEANLPDVVELSRRLDGIPLTTVVLLRADSSDLDALVAELDLDSKVAADGFDVLAQSIDLGALDVAMLDPRNPVLTYVQPGCQLDLGQVRRFTQLSQPVGAHLLEHPPLVRIHLGAINRAVTHQL
jgi:hypothetical protein